MNLRSKMLIASSVMLCSISHAIVGSIFLSARQAIDVGSQSFVCLNVAQRASKLTSEIFTVLAHRAEKQPLEPFDSCLQLALRATCVEEFYEKRNLRVAALLHQYDVMYGTYFNKPQKIGSLLGYIGFPSRIVAPIRVQPHLISYLENTESEKNRIYWETVHPDAVSLAKGLRRAKRTLSELKAPLDVCEDDVYQELLNGLRERI